MNKLELGKNYETVRDGLPVEILSVSMRARTGIKVVSAVDLPNGCQGIYITDVFGCIAGRQMIREVSPYADFKIDDKVLVWDSPEFAKERRYFAGLDKDGRPMVFRLGATSWTNKGRTRTWNYCERAET